VERFTGKRSEEVLGRVAIEVFPRVGVRAPSRRYSGGRYKEKLPK